MPHAALLLTLTLFVADERPKDQSAALRRICSHLHIETGSVIADIGAGKGRDAAVFAEVVGPEGMVYAEEIEEGKVKGIKEEAKKRKLPQITPVLGTGTDPNIPDNSVDLIYMHRVYHHFAEPRPMLRGMLKGLRPGGYMVIVDRQRGTLQDWVPRKARAKKHHWIGETTVVREAREEGFLFVKECADTCWHKSDVFVLVFRRPLGNGAPKGDPDPFLPLDPAATVQHLLSVDGGSYARAAIVALGEGRKLLPALLKATEEGCHEIVLEEWATQKKERPPLPDGLSFPSSLTEKGDPHLPDEPLSAVFFLDSYHLLFHGKTLLAKIHERLAPTGMVYVLDRRAPGRLPRVEASHRRAIHPMTVEEEMTKAGFHLWKRGPKPAPDRFLLLFGKVQVVKRGEDDVE